MLKFRPESYYLPLSQDLDCASGTKNRRVLSWLNAAFMRALGTKYRVMALSGLRYSARRGILSRQCADKVASLAFRPGLERHSPIPQAFWWRSDVRNCYSKLPSSVATHTPLVLGVLGRLFESEILRAGLGSALGSSTALFFFLSFFLFFLCVALANRV